MCMGCDPCYRLYWLFECEGDECSYVGHWDPREGAESPGWLEEIQVSEEMYDYWNYSMPDSTWASCHDVTKTPRENAEAEEAALWMSGSLIAPDSLYFIIERQLALIREEYGEQLPRLKTLHFSPYLYSNRLMISLRPEAMQRYEAGTYEDLDSLNAVFKLKTMSHMFGTVFLATFEGRYHPLGIAEVYWQVPSVEYAEPDGIGIISVPSTVIPRRRE